MRDLRVSELMDMQDRLQERMKGKWLPMTPENGHFSLLWMFEELGEVVAIIKKRGDGAIMGDEAVRTAFVEEMADALMYYVDMAGCYGVSAEELSSAYVAKHEKNMRRDFVAEHRGFLSGE